MNIKDVLERFKGSKILFLTKCRATALFFILNICLFTTSRAQQLHPEWERTYGISNHETGNSLVEAEDGFLIGETLRINQQEDYGVIKLDKTGNKLWEKTFGGANSDQLQKVITTKDGGFLLAGNSNSGIGGDKTEGSKGNGDFWIVKISKDGTKVWDRTFGTSNNEGLIDIVECKDGGYLLGGYTAPPQGYNYSDYWVVKINSSGSKEWDKSYSGAAADSEYQGRDHLEKIVPVVNGGFLLAGFSGSKAGKDKSESAFLGRSGEPTFDIWIIKISDSGVKEWDKVFGGNGYESVEDAYQSSDGGFVISGSSNSPISGNKTAGPEDAPGGYFTHTWLFKLDGFGIKYLENVVYPKPNNEMGRMLIAPFPNGFYLSYVDYNEGEFGDTKVISSKYTLKRP